MQTSKNTKNALISGFENHLQGTLKCNLEKYALCHSTRPDSNGLHQEAYIFYVHLQDGTTLIHRIIEETEHFWKQYKTSPTVSGAEYPDGTLIKDNTIILILKYYA